MRYIQSELAFILPLGEEWFAEAIVFEAKVARRDPEEMTEQHPRQRPPDDMTLGIHLEVKPLRSFSFSEGQMLRGHMDVGPVPTDTREPHVDVVAR